MGQAGAPEEAYASSAAWDEAAEGYKDFGSMRSTTSLAGLKPGDTFLDVATGPGAKLNDP
jgi:ubiquinone/menaquinone biosynthesis C-methylase UbiE